MTISGQIDRQAEVALNRPAKPSGPAITRFVIHVILIAGAIVLLLPIAWMLSTSLKDLGAVLIIPPQWIPDELRWSNYLEVFQVTPFARFILNTTSCNQTWTSTQDGSRSAVRSHCAIY